MYRILFFGDSITQGLWDAEGGWVERIRRQCSELARQNLSENVYIQVFNLGISGNTTEDLLLRIEHETRARKSEGVPTIVAIAGGTNDVAFEAGAQKVSPEKFAANVAELVQKVRGIADQIILIGNPSCDESRTNPISWSDSYYLNRELERSENSIREIADQHNLPFVSLYSEFKKRFDAGEHFLEDGLHPTTQGHEFIAKKVLETIKQLKIGL